MRASQLAVLLAILGACGRTPEIPPPSKAERAAILQAVQDYVARRSGPDGLVVRDDGAGTDRTLQVQYVSRAVKVVRYRLSLVEGQAEDAEGKRYPIRFYVLQSGPIFLVDTVHVPAPGTPPFAP